MYSSPFHHLSKIPMKLVRDDVCLGLLTRTSLACAAEPGKPNIL